MNELNINLIKNATKVAIEETTEFKYIMHRIKQRAESGYSYIYFKYDEEFLRCLNSFSIREYLSFLGYVIQDDDDVIRWSLL